MLSFLNIIFNFISSLFFPKIKTQEEFDAFTSKGIQRESSSDNLQLETNNRGRIKIDETNGVDWRVRGSSIKSQDPYDCNACTAYAAIGAIESQFYKLTKSLVSLSEQFLIDCNFFASSMCQEGANVKDRM